MYLGQGEQFRALDARLTQPVLDAGLIRLNAIEHPVLRGDVLVERALLVALEEGFGGGERDGARDVEAPETSESIRSARQKSKAAS